MFNTLTSYLLGNTTRSDTNNNTNNNNTKYNNQEAIAEATGEPEPFTKFNLSTTVCDEDDDWLLVVETKEEEDSLPRTDSEGELPLVKVKNSRRRRNRQHQQQQQQQHQPQQQSRDGSLGDFQQLSLLPYPSISSMEESWFVTPPPCFTSTGPILLETSPLENLLIEHPSMSVYHSLRNSTRDIDVEEDMVVLDLIMESVSDEAEDIPVNQATVRSPPRHRVYQIADINERQLKQELLNKNAQKHQVRKHRQIYSRNAMERLNKTREVNSKGGHQKRSDLQHAKTCSRVNNNRKC